MAEQFARRTGIPFVGLRISNIMEPTDYARFPTLQDDARMRKWNLWGYVDARDVAAAVRGALEADTTGAEVCIVAAADTVMTRDSADLMAEVFPDVPLRREVRGRETLLAIDQARDLLGYLPAHAWQDELAAAGRHGDGDRRTPPAVACPGAHGPPSPADALRSATTIRRGAGRDVAVPAARTRRTPSPARTGARAAVPGCWTMQGFDDLPQYTNVQMPFPGLPPDVPEHNPTGVYEREFELPERWAGLRVVLHVGAAESVLHRPVNGEDVGLSKDSHLAAEFDVTDLVRPGPNTLTAARREVVRRDVRRGPGPVVARRDHPVRVPVLDRAGLPGRHPGDRRAGRRPPDGNA